MATAPVAGARMAGDSGLALAVAGAARALGRDLSARQQILSRLLSVRRQARASNPWHAADTQARARAVASARLRRQRVRAGDLRTRRCRAAHRSRRAQPFGAV